MSLRETLAIHAKRRECRSCHNRMDPLGLALENFNAMGVWRTEEMHLPIEHEGKLITGEAFSNIQELKKLLVTGNCNNYRKFVVLSDFFTKFKTIYSWHVNISYNNWLFHS